MRQSLTFIDFITHLNENNLYLKMPLDLLLFEIYSISLHMVLGCAKARMIIAIRTQASYCICLYR